MTNWRCNVGISRSGVHDIIVKPTFANTYNNKILLPRFSKGLFQDAQRVVKLYSLPIISQNGSIVVLHIVINHL